MKLLLLLIALILASATAHSQLSGRIYYLPDSLQKVINLGPCYVGDNVFAKFMIKNTGKQTLRMLGVSPSIEVYASPYSLTQFEYLRFSHDAPSLPFNLTYNDRMIETLVMKYSSQIDVVAEPVGRKEAMLKLGLVNPADTTQIVVQDTFRLITRKTFRFVEGFEEEVKFDSVIINSSINNSKKFRVRNTQNQILDIVSAYDSLSSQQGSSKEFFFEQKNFPISILPKTSTVDWDISYIPKDLGGDTTIFKVFFVPKPALKPDSLDYCFVKAMGIGIKQELSIESANANFSNDTIFLGDVPMQSGKSLTIKLKNTGNFPFGAVGQYFIDGITGKAPLGFDIEKQFQAGKGHLGPKLSGEVQILIKPLDRGYFSVKYIIESDLAFRKISGYQDSDKRIEIHLIGRAVEPEIIAQNDTIDFGKVVFSGDLFGDCPSRKDTVFRLSNIGNFPLSINDILLDDDFNFSLSEREMIIDGNSEKWVLISYHSSFPPAEYISKMRIVSNSSSPKDTLTITLIGNSVPPVLADLSISDSLKAKPGTTFSVPIILKNEYYKPAIYAKYYEMDLNFNPSLLRFQGFETISTASEGANVSIEKTENNGSIKLIVSAIDYLLPSDTLLFLKFKAYIGNKLSTEIAINNALFGSGNCKRVIDTKIAFGLFTLDSVCGLPFKLLPTDFTLPKIVGISPNPASDYLSFDYFLPTGKNAQFHLFNSYGLEIIKIETNGQSEGNNKSKTTINNLPAGVYFLEMRSGGIVETKSVIIE